jgi:S1-C subfamily serine protease
MSDTASNVAPPPSPLQTLSAALAGLVAAAAPSLVAVHSHRSRSSGFAWRPGLIVTADEALAEDGEIGVVLPGRGEATKATLVGRDSTTDIALLRVEGAEVPPFPLEAAPVEAGALAVAVGSREGMPVAALGAVSLAGPGWRSLRGGEIDARIELDLSLRRHAEGGPALDAAGRAFGMAVFGPRRRVLVIPAATIERVGGTLAAHGRIPRGYLGLGLQPVRLDDGGVGAMAMSVDAKGPGAAAVLRQGDVIVAWDGQPIQGVQSLLRRLGPGSVGSVVTLSGRRAGQPLEVKLTIGERP